jgi:hypothetical protein
MKMQAQLESIATNTTPATIAVGSLVFLGISLSNWVLIVTLTAGLIQIMILLPKWLRSFSETKKEFKRLVQGHEDHGCEYGHTKQASRDGCESSDRETELRGSNSIGGCSGAEDVKGQRHSGCAGKEFTISKSD